MGLLQRGLAGQDLLDAALDLGHVRGRHLAIVHGRGEALLLDLDARDVGQELAQPRAGPGHVVEQPGVRLPPDLGLRARDVEAVAARVVELVQRDERRDLVAAATAHHGHRAARRERAHHVARGLGQERSIGILDDRRQRAVVVEEHDQLAAVQPGRELGPARQRRRQAARVLHEPPVEDLGRDVLERGDDHVSAALAQGPALALAIHAHDQAEAAALAGLHACQRILEQDRIAGLDAEPPGALQEGVGAGLASEPELGRELTVDARIE